MLHKRLLIDAGYHARLDGRAAARRLTHENFLREYGDAVKGVPLVIYEGRVNRQSKRPFKLAPGK